MTTPWKTLSERVRDSVRIIHLPVGIKLAHEGEAIPQKARRPLADMGHAIAVCQAMTIARTIGWTMVFEKGDHGCPVPPVLLGMARPDRFLQGHLASYYQDREEVAKAMEASYPRWPMDEIKEVWISPLERCEFTPDVVVIYGNPAQILSLIHAANFRKGEGVTSISTGRFGCSAWLAGVVQSQKPTYLIPGPGERVFAGTQDYEVSFALPLNAIDDFLEGLEYVRRKGAYRYPVPNLSVMGKPAMPGDYFKILEDD
ncbi:MAG: hypothetical protein COZ70_05985 [Deltaproteobacteria bacterium CG_4_8_14_3_um_filter_51_11]|nr:DUF169 domain-containing protein [bacterium]OIP39750.1 MAG: hypothetical protein AUK25_09640 [Desulfobacteraceae bacterium CG2_30_51_40]PIP45949.1 MAG: hypothetical protein COX16_10610 [Deltaproteobacteria bacterium CG23_combo_of_CG06-09_8_20_14_all_51_20]PIW00807.1 MAG: hypothetical protein COW41_04420 [Deltaproteobacteria bacterium CG17_big_fil_post_rev_8_21_14_2_50_51_6]PIX19991.1 MAG: hypothetical protein COZ70_05985 [Deltaproteobacteria bacterium CG_4_8_14_3_um_filter_51_11]PIY26499.1 